MTFIHLHKTNLNILDKIRDLSDPDSDVTEMFPDPETFKDISKTVHDTSVV